MRSWFGRRRRGEAAQADPDPEFDARGRVTPASLARMREAAEAGQAVAMANLGVALYLAGDRTGALHWLGQAWDAGNVAAGFNLGTLYAEAGDSNRAQVVWERSATLGDPDAMLGLVKQGLERGDQAAVERWSALIHAQDAAFPITALGVAHRDHGNEAEAVRAFLRAEELGDAYAMEYRARILDAHGRREEADALRARAARSERMR